MNFRHIVTPNIREVALLLSMGCSLMICDHMKMSIMFTLAFTYILNIEQNKYQYIQSTNPTAMVTTTNRNRPTDNDSVNVAKHVKASAKVEHFKRDGRKRI